ncbi:MAG: SOS response-associated peptidase [Alphaproteobacteria bacterium]|nr:SOS response-associated peptidase [Alphaproteobacteria bacterium]
MCGRFLLTSPPEAVARVFGVEVRDNFPPRWNIAPTQPVATIRVDDGKLIAERRPRYALMRWGFIPSWAKADHLLRLRSKPLINARAETAAEKPTFRAAWKRRRCLVPADGFYEWRRDESGRTPFRITPSERFGNNGLVGFGALWETAHDPDGGEIDTVAILTVAAGADVGALHHREPVVIAPHDYENWLMTEETSAGAMGEMVAPAPAGSWEIAEAPKDLNNARHEGSRLSGEKEQGELFRK